MYEEIVKRLILCLPTDNQAEPFHLLLDAEFIFGVVFLISSIASLAEDVS